MSPTQLAEELQAQGLLPAEQADAIRQDERTRPFSLHQELRAALYLGILLLTGGLGVLLYQHVDDIGFEIIIPGMFLLMLASFGYVVHQRQPFTWEQTKPVSFVPDYVLLLGCLLFLALDTYFAEGRYGLATLLPAVLFFGLAYRFDHRGVLAMAITAVASWVGVSIAPLSTYSTYSFHHSSLSSVGVGLGLLLAGVGLLSDLLRRKRHFAFTYILLGANLALVAAASMLLDSMWHNLLILSDLYNLVSDLYNSLSDLFSPRSGHRRPVLQPVGQLPNWPVVLLILALSAGLVWYSRRTRSYLFLLVGSLYAYFAVTCLFITLFVFMLDHRYGLTELTVYFMLSAAVAVLLFLNSKKFLRLS